MPETTTTVGLLVSAVVSLAGLVGLLARWWRADTKAAAATFAKAIKDVTDKFDASIERVTARFDAALDRQDAARATDADRLAREVRDLGARLDECPHRHALPVLDREGKG